MGAVQPLAVWVLFFIVLSGYASQFRVGLTVDKYILFSFYPTKHSCVLEGMTEDILGKDGS